MLTINPLNATADQIAVLFDLNADAAAEVVRAGPYNDLTELTAALPKNRDRAGEAMEKIDINHASQSQLKNGLKLGTKIAKAILAGRPYFSIFEIGHVAELDQPDIARLLSVYRGPSLGFTDKSLGQNVQIRPSSDRLLLVTTTEQEAAGLPGRLQQLGLMPSPATMGPKSLYRLFDIPQSENGAALRRRVMTDAAVERVIPAMRTDDGDEVFLDPAFVVVQFAPSVTKNKQEQLLNDLGLAIERRHRAPGLVTIQIPGGAIDPSGAFAAINGLNQLDEVEFAEPAYIGIDDTQSPVTDVAPTTAGPDVPWNQAAIGLADAHSVTRGNPNVIVAVIDSGVDDTHPDLSDSLLPRGQKDWNFEDLDERRPLDILGHGTFIAGLIGGAGGTGIAPDCRILPLRVPLRGGIAAYADRRAAILYALDQVQPGQRLVVNISWRTATNVASVRTALEQASERGAIIVASAGNWPESPDQPHYPSDYPFVISVAATTPNGVRAEYSYFGAAIDFAAPGGEGPGENATNITSLAIDGGLRQDFGTSFAAPHVTASIALLLSHDPGMDADAIRQLLGETACQLPQEGTGAGLIRIGAALAPNRNPTNSPPLTDQGDLLALNTLGKDVLVAEFGLLAFTARLIIARRPISGPQDLDGVLGLSDAQREALLGAQPPAAPHIGTDPANSATMEELMTYDGLPPFTARLVIAKRPHQDPDDVARLLGMPAEIAARLSSALQ